MPGDDRYIRWFDQIRNDDVALVGGKNASLGEMFSNLKERGIRVPDGFAITSEAYWRFIESNDLREPLVDHLHDLRDGAESLETVARAIRKAIRRAWIPEEIAEEIRSAYAELSRRYEMEEADVAVRSSATAEDLPHASFAGQQESYLNIIGEAELMERCRRCYASLFTDRAISYRVEKGFRHMEVALSVGVQKMVRADKASAGVAFSLDTESGFPDAVMINAAWGLGENVVKGRVTPDQYTVYKPFLDREGVVPIVEKSLGEKERKEIYVSGAHGGSQSYYTHEGERGTYVLSDEEILQLARWTGTIEDHYGMPMDVEWAKDGETGELFIVQARPETVQSQREAGSIKSYRLLGEGEQLVAGLSVGEAVAAGRVNRVLDVADADQVEDGAILVTRMTDPDWVPVMKRVAGIVTDTGGRTCHAAIVSRELGIPAIVGTGNGTEVLETGEEVTISCAEGDEGHVFRGLLEFDEVDVDLEDVPETRTRLMLNVGSPAAAFRWWRLPTDGVGLARMEFIIGNRIRIHPMALVRYDELVDEEAKEEIAELTRGYEDKTEYFVDHLARGIAKIACVHHPDPVIVRMSDFKTNEYADLIGGRAFEAPESNPMLGFRGAARYYSDRYREGFALECAAIRRVREELGLDNVLIMIPFCRTLAEADRVLEVLAENGLRRGEDGLEVYMMCEVPSNVILAEEFAERFDGFSIGSNDLTQLTLGVDRDSGDLAYLFDERDEAVKRSLRRVIDAAHETGTKVGICGQAPSDHPDFAEFLVEAGIDSMSLNPDSLLRVKRSVAEVEGRLAVESTGTASTPA
jgi:pyruvate,water dikinase